MFNAIASAAFYLCLTVVVFRISDLLLKPTSVIAAFNTVYFCIQRPVAGVEGEGGSYRAQTSGIIEHKSNCYPAAVFTIIKGEMCNPGSDWLEHKWPKSDCHCAQWTSLRGQQFGLVD